MTAEEQTCFSNLTSNGIYGITLDFGTEALANDLNKIH
jgi:hypothetical protein